MGGGSGPRLLLRLRRRWRSAAAARWLQAARRDTAGHGQSRGRDPPRGRDTHPSPPTPRHPDSGASTLSPLAGGGGGKGLRFLRRSVRVSHWVTRGAEVMSPGVGASPVPAVGQWDAAPSPCSMEGCPPPPAQYITYCPLGTSGIKAQLINNKNAGSPRGLQSCLLLGVGPPPALDWAGLCWAKPQKPPGVENP